MKVTHSLLQERNFKCLEGAIHTSGRRKVCISSLCVAKPTKVVMYPMNQQFYKVPVIKKKHTHGNMWPDGLITEMKTLISLGVTGLQITVCN